jgi:GNAT superfamily N-acetyltransferase
LTRPPLPPQTKVRPAVPGDIDVLTMLLELLFSVEEDFQFDAKRQRKGLKMMLDNSAACILVAEIEGKVVGMCSGQTTISTAEGGPALLVEDVVVATDWRGRKIGKGLVQALGDWAARRGIARLQLLADRNNGTALEFYRKLGWQTTSLIALRHYTEIAR